ncbi:MAG: AMIN domain-containing protein, partial [Gammaproteobacteria bacterium]|nr:AMIN domain-containing protein [Gammaproteobacteria bacterium]
MTTKSTKINKRTNLRMRLVTGLLSTLLLPCNLAANSLNELEYSELPNGSVQLKLTLSDSPVEPNGFTIDEPPRLVLDFPDTENKLAENRIELGLDLARTIIALEDSQRTRIVVNLSNAATWKTETKGNDTYITIGSVVPQGQVAVPTTTKTSSAHQITDIDFNRGLNGEARMTIGLSSPAIAVNSREEPGAVVVEFLSTSVPAQLANRLNVIDFGTPVSLVETKQNSENVEMVISAAGEYNVLAYQTDQNYTIEIQPLNTLSSAEIDRRKKSYNGERLSLNLQNIEVRSVLQLLADFTGRNLVASDTVTGNVTLRLKNVPWDQALDIILSTKGLAKREDGNVMWVAPAEEIAARERLELESLQQLEELAPLYTEYVSINFARATDLAALISADENNLLTERGSISIDERTNTLILHDTEEKIADVRQLIGTLDVPVQQVLIESRIVNASTDFSKNLGVRFGPFKANGISSPQAISGSLAATTQALNGDTIEFDDRLNVNMPAGGIGGISASSIAFAISKADQL